MIWGLSALIYLAMCWGAYRLLEKAWLKKHNLTRFDRSQFIWMSIGGPISFLVGLVIYFVLERPERNKDEVLKLSNKVGGRP